MATDEGVSLTKLKERGYKLTPQRAAVFRVLEQSREPLTPAEACRRVKEHLPLVGLTTVYRTLQILEALGLVEKVHRKEGCHRYIATSLGHRHPLVCSHCGLVVEVEACGIADLASTVAKAADFEVSGHWLELYGRCRQCRMVASPTGGNL